MANVLRKSQVWTVNTIGMLQATPVRIKFIQVYPSAAGDAFELDWWDESAAITNSDVGATATITTSNTFTATTSVITAAAFPQYAVAEIVTSTGSTANITKQVIGTGGNNTAFVTMDAALTNEAAKSYRVRAFQNYVAFAGIAQATNKMDAYYFFGDQGLYLPNLFLKSISSNAVLYIGICAN